MEHDEKMTSRTSRDPSFATRLRTVAELVGVGGRRDNRSTGVTPPLHVGQALSRRGERAHGEAARRPLRPLRRGAWTSVTPALLDDAATEARRELRYRECGYGAIVRGDAPTCPMCRATSWVEHARRASGRRRVYHAL